jgi:CubicO group peptidase (beta-lactamase class C family)
MHSTEEIMRNGILKIVITVLTCYWCAKVQGGETEPSPQDLQQLKDSISEIVERYNIPAVGIAMVDKSGPIWIDAIGKSNLEKNIEADKNTLFRIGSTSKMFVGLAVLKLVEQGSLKLTDKLSDLIPEIEFRNRWEDSAPIQLVHLLEHTTGWDEQHYPEFAHNDPTPVTLKQGLDFHPHSRTSRWVPGTRYAYNNSGPSVAAYIVAKITNQPFEEYVEQEFLSPIGMKNTTFFETENMRDLGAVGYNNDNEPYDYKHLLMRPAGAINSSPRDLAKLLQFFINRGKMEQHRILSSASIARMEQQKSTPAGLQTGYGLTNYSSAFDTWVYREHNGGMQGALSEFAYLPEANLGHAILLNSDNQAAFKKISNLIRAFETKSLSVQDSVYTGTITPEHRELAGVYYPINPRVQKLDFMFYITGMKTLSFEGDTLVQSKAIGTRKNYFYPVSESAFKSKLTGLVSLAKVVDPLEGEVVHLAYKNASNNNFVLKRVNGFFAYSQLFSAILWLLALVSTIVYVVLWLIRCLRGKASTAISAQIRTWPLIAAGSMFITYFLLFISSTDPYLYLASITWVSALIWLTTICFAASSLMSVFVIARAFRSGVSLWDHKYFTVLSVLHFLMALSLIYFGVIGIMFWE